ncbi:hypothetical protein A2U01_0092119, partial [Trifolium medium]|nr:hypothetical protein [Trifolium medium]
MATNSETTELFACCNNSIDQIEVPDDEEDLEFEPQQL